MSNNNINWSKLVNQGRAKAIGVSWTEEEAVALSKCNPVEREAMIAKLRGGTVGEKAKVETGDKVLTPEEVETEKERVKAEKKVQADAKKAEAKAKKEAEKPAKK